MLIIEMIVIKSQILLPKIELFWSLRRNYLFQLHKKEMWFFEKSNAPGKWKACDWKKKLAVKGEGISMTLVEYKHTYIQPLYLIIIL